MTDEMYVKNKKRNVVADKVEPFVPEYERLGVTPIVKESEDIVFKAKKNENKVRKSLLLDSKENEESSESSDSQQNQYGLDNQEQDPNAEIFKAAEVQLPRDVARKRRVHIEQEEPVQEEAPSFTLEAIPVGDYVLLYKDSVLASGKLDKVKEVLTDVCLYSENADQVSIEDFVVLKRVSVKAGVFVDE